MSVSSDSTLLDDAETLPRRFGFWTALFVVIASMVGSGILTTSGFTIQATANHRVLLALWAAGGFMAIAGSLTLAELATMLPRVGGEYAFVREGFGPRAAFVYGWATQLFGFAGPIALVATIAADYLLEPLTNYMGRDIRLMWSAPLATILIAVFTTIHCLGHRESAWAQAATTVFKLTTLAGFALTGLVAGAGDWGHLQQGRPLLDQSPATLGVSLLYVMYGYTGWNGAVYLAGEIQSPGRRLPPALFIGCGLVTCLYLLMNLAYAYAIAPGSLASEPAPVVAAVAALAASRLFSPVAASVWSLLFGMGLLATLSAFILTGARVAFVMGRDGLFPKVVGALNASRGAPTPATLLQGLLATALLWSGAFKTLLDFTSTGLAVVAGLVVASIFPLRRLDLPRPFRVPAYPVPPVLFLTGTGAMVGLGFWHDPVTSATSLFCLGLAIPVHALMSRRSRTR